MSGHWKFNRPGEEIGGGFIVVRRGARTKRLTMKVEKHISRSMPFEHPNAESAMAEASRLASEAQDGGYDVLKVVAHFDGAKNSSGNQVLDKTGDHPNGKTKNSEENRKEKSGGSEEEVNNQSGVTN